MTIAAEVTEPIDEVVLVRLVGVLSRGTVTTVRRVLLECLAWLPRKIVVDISELAVESSADLTVFLGVATSQASTNVPFLLVCPSAALRRMFSQGVPQQIGVYDTVEQALAAVDTAAPTRLRRLRLDPVITAPAAARAFVTDACRDWRLPDLARPAALVISELTANAVEHADTPMTVSVAVRGQQLYLSVRDASARPAQLTATAAGPVPPSRGWGLRLVADVAASWGSLPLDGGKRVWACLALGAGTVATRLGAEPEHRT